jgi:hypothetical protein
MRFAKYVFIAAGIWGIFVLTPFYWLVDITGRHYAPPTEYPHFFYGFFAITFAWQFAFLVIGSNPARFRLLIIPSIFEKFSYVVTLIVLYSQARISAADFQAIVPDAILGTLFVAALVTTRESAQRDSRIARSLQTH